MCKVDEHIKKAKESLEAVDFSDLNKIFSDDRGEYSMADGSVGVVLMHDEDGAEILVLTMDPEALIPLHEHDERETYFVLSGDVEIRKRGMVVSLCAGESNYTLPNIPHTAFSKSGCRLILVRTPSSKEQRNGTKR